MSNRASEVRWLAVEVMRWELQDTEVDGWICMENGRRWNVRYQSVAAYWNPFESEADCMAMVRAMAPDVLERYGRALCEDLIDDEVISGTTACYLPLLAASCEARAKAALRATGYVE